MIIIIMYYCYYHHCYCYYYYYYHYYYYHHYYYYLATSSGGTSGPTRSFFVTYLGAKDCTPEINPQKSSWIFSGIFQWNFTYVMSGV